MMSRWSIWLDIENFGSIGKHCGVYKIRLADLAGRPKTIRRFLGSDKEGLLAIGESMNLARRIREFHHAYTGKRFLRHSVGDRLFLVRICQHTSLRINFGNYKLQVAVIILENKTEAQREEENFLKAYFKEYGELPPLNSSMPDKGDWDSIVMDVSGQSFF